MAYTKTFTDYVYSIQIDITKPNAMFYDQLYMNGWHEKYKVFCFAYAFWICMSLQSCIAEISLKHRKEYKKESD